MPSPTGTHLTRAPEAIDRAIGPEVLVILGGSDEVRRLRGPMALVWQALVEPRPIEEITAVLAESAPAGVDASAVVGECIDALHASGLVTSLDERSRR